MKALLWAGLVLAATLALAAPGKSDPCAAIAGKRWVAPSEARACLTAAPIDYVVKNNVRGAYSQLRYSNIICPDLGGSNKDPCIPYVD